MAEYYPVLTGKQIAYSGYFDLAKVWKLIKDFCDQRGYGVYEKQHNEVTRETGKDIDISMDCEKSLSEYAVGTVRCGLKCKDVTDTIIERDGKKQSVNEGSLTISFDVFIRTDLEGRYERSPHMFFYRMLMEKLTQNRMLQKNKTLVEQDALALIKELKSYLNLYVL